jgi:hypothetical protein
MNTDELVKYAFPVAIRVSYPCDPPGKPHRPAEGALRGAYAVQSDTATSLEPPAKRTRRASGGEGQGHGQGEGSPAVAPEAEGRAVVELQGVACMMMRESEFFLGALSNGFRETATKVIDYHADSQQGEQRLQLGCS